MRLSEKGNRGEMCVRQFCSLESVFLLIRNEDRLTEPISCSTFIGKGNEFLAGTQLLGNTKARLL